MSGDDNKCTAARAIAREIAWKHFDVHAKQRIEVFKCYLTLVAVIFAGYGVSFQTKSYGLGILVGFFSILLSILFLQLDQRTRDLIKLSETYLREDEARLAKDTGSDSILLFSESDRLSELSTKSGHRISYGNIVSRFFWVNIGLASIFMIVFIFSIASS